MNRIAKQKSHPAEGRKETPVVVFLWVFGLALTFYILARIVLAAYPHPYHWISMAIGAVVGYFWGWAWFRWKGDVL